MKLNIFKRISTFLLISSFMILPLKAHFSHVEHYLEEIKKEVSRSPSEIGAIAARKINGGYLEELSPDSSIDNSRLGQSKSYLEEGTWGQLRESNTTTPIALAVVTADLDLLEKMLPHLSDVNQFVAWGYRQPYSLAHVALNPVYPVEFEVPLETRLRAIDLLAQFGVNYNHLFGTEQYNNPPLSAGEPSGNNSPFRDQLRARAMVYGADPSIRGTSFMHIAHYYDPNDENYFKTGQTAASLGLVYTYYLELLNTEMGKFLKLSEWIKEGLYRLAEQNNRLDLLPTLESEKRKEKKKKAAEEAAAKEEARRKAAEARKLREEQERKEAEEARMRAEEEARKLREEQKRKEAEDARMRVEEEARKLREEQKRKEAEDARMRAEEEARKLREEQKRKEAEDARMRAEEKARKLREEQERKEAEDARIRAEEEAKKIADENAALEAKKKWCILL